VHAASGPERPVAVFGAANEIVILRAELIQPPATTEAALDVTWQVLRTPGFDYNVFFQALTPENGGMETVALLDTQPLQGQAPATSWQPIRNCSRRWQNCSDRWSEQQVKGKRL
jgi:hypothetical protein